MRSRIRAWAARCWSVKVSSLWTRRSAWIQHRACSPRANWPASSLTITVPGSRPCALMAPQRAFGGQARRREAALHAADAEPLEVHSPGRLVGEDALRMAGQAGD